MNVIQGEDWRALILAYLHHYYKPDTIVEQMRMQQRARAYQIVDNDLYKILVSGPLLRCVSKEDGSKYCQRCTQEYVQVTLELEP
jgi:hypothetical protein